MENNKLIRSASVIDRILKILQGFALAGVIVAAIFIPLTLIFGEKIVVNSSYVDIGVLNLHLAVDSAEYLDLGHLKLSICSMLAGMILVSAATWYCLKVLREILVPMKEGTPFAEGISAKIRKLAWTVLIGGGIAEISAKVATVFETRAYHIEKLLDDSVVKSISYDYKISLWFVVAALILFFLSYIFRYGEELQRESDETL
ncbi:MAG: DUF2975 domain-containing protein [Clostridia bacterium]|nr:DUF2975 domain-containing protein [Clostridia bacterium]